MDRKIRKNLFKQILIISLLLFVVLVFPNSAWAIRFDLIAPSGQLIRGQDVDFIINIDTENEIVTYQQIGITYDTQYLQYVKTTAGTAMTSVSTEDQGSGKLLLTGNNSSGFTGTGSFAIVTLKIIAESPGSTELCTLWLPTPTSTPGPTTVPASTTAPVPTNLPRTGGTETAYYAGIFGVIVLAGAIGLYFFSKKT